MPYKFVENKPIINSYHGVSVYHLYRNDELSEGPRKYWFTTDPLGVEGDENAFDIREKPGYSPEISAAMNLIHMIDAGVFGAAGILEQKDHDKRFPEDGAEENRCPICGSKINFGDSHITEGRIGFNFECPNCGVTGCERHVIKYECSEVN